MLRQQTLLHFPKLLRQVHIVSLRIFETQGFGPQSIHLLHAVVFDFFDIRAFVYTFTLIKNLYMQVSHFIVCQNLALPYCVWIEDFIFVSFFDFFICMVITSASIFPVSLS